MSKNTGYSAYGCSSQPIPFLFDMKPLQLILLVDDDTTSNFLNEQLLQELRIARETQVLTNGKRALDYLLEHSRLMRKSLP